MCAQCTSRSHGPSIPMINSSRNLQQRLMPYEYYPDMEVEERWVEINGRMMAGLPGASCALQEVRQLCPHGFCVRTLGWV